MNTEREHHKQAAIIRLALDEAFGVLFPMDILVRAPEEIDRRVKQGGFLYKKDP